MVRRIASPSDGQSLESMPVFGDTSELKTDIDIVNKFLRRAGIPRNDAVDQSSHPLRSNAFPNQRAIDQIAAPEVSFDDHQGRRD